MGCHRLDSLTPTGFIPKANYPMFRREECIRINGRWVHLRICQTCGKMLCGDSSEHQHARRHHEEMGHPVMRSAEPGEQWLWCYVDKAPQNY